MPLDLFQKSIFKLLASTRSEGYVAGASVINRLDSSLRYSQDIDIFHDRADKVASSALADEAVLRSDGFKIEWELQQPSFFRGIVKKNGQSLRLEWAVDSAYRFFPLVKDEAFGARLHDLDSATNKILACASRNEIRDYVDISYLHDSYLSLFLLIWAACGKDEGFTPDFLLEEIMRKVCFKQSELDLLRLNQPMDVKKFKIKLNAMFESTKINFGKLDPKHIGGVYLNNKFEPINPLETDAFQIHYGKLYGAWPKPLN